jgi:hypothetical protein
MRDSATKLGATSTTSLAAFVQTTIDAPLLSR